MLAPVERVVAIVEPERREIGAVTRDDVDEQRLAVLARYDPAPRLVPGEQIVDGLGAVLAADELGSWRRCSWVADRDPAAVVCRSLDGDGACLPKLRQRDGRKRRRRWR